MHPLKTVWLLALLCFACADLAAQEASFSGVVTRVFDGDSFLVRPAGQRQDVDVRLMDIDAPEKDQPYADVSRAALRKLIDGRRVFVDVIETDRYRRKIARVYREPDRLEVAVALVHDGHVWVYRRAVRDRALIELEDRARARKAGLWALPEASRVAPWRFRRERREERKLEQAVQQKQDTAAHSPRELR